MSRIVLTITYIIGITILLYAVTCLYLCETLGDAFVERHKCPACYGETFCNHLFLQSHNTSLYKNHWNLFTYFNSRNVYFGSFNSTPVVFKKLGHTWELEKFDQDLCALVEERFIMGHMNTICDPGAALRQLLHRYNGKISSFVHNCPKMFENCDAVMCTPQSQVIEYLFEKFQERVRHRYLKEFFITLLAINPEPLILMVR